MNFRLVRTLVSWVALLPHSEKSWVQIHRSISPDSLERYPITVPIWLKITHYSCFIILKHMKRMNMQNLQLQLAKGQCSIKV